MRADGDCFQAAAIYILDEDDDAGLVLVHGEVSGQGRLAGVQYGHAWVEDDRGFVIDRSNGRFLRLERAIYYMIGRIDEGTTKRYTRREMCEKLVETKHYGPWDLVTSTGL